MRFPYLLVFILPVVALAFPYRPPADYAPGRSPNCDLLADTNYHSDPLMSRDGDGSIKFDSIAAWNDLVERMTSPKYYVANPDILAVATLVRSLRLWHILFELRRAASAPLVTLHVFVAQPCAEPRPFYPHLDGRRSHVSVVIVATILLAKAARSYALTIS